MATPTSIQRKLRRLLSEAGDPQRAKQQQAYMKSTMPFAGVPVPETTRMARTLFKAETLASKEVWIETIEKLWREAKVREERYATLSLIGLRNYQGWRDTALLPVYEELIITGAWWDFVDEIAAKLVGELLAKHPRKVTPVLRRWSKGEDIWKRRTAILAQLKFGTGTNFALLEAFMAPSIESREFFLRKAIGWALREYSKTNPHAVIDYVARHEDTLSGLSKREALKVLNRKAG
jgi:3-methyladenine DNA glycosylase AlkD